MTPALLEIESHPSTTAAPLLQAGPASAAQGAAWERFLALPPPVRTDEDWRFSSTKALDLTSYTAPQPLEVRAADELIERSSGLAAAAGRMVFANDTLVARDILNDKLRQKGVLWLPLDQALAEHSDLVRRYFMREDAILGGRKFAALHEAQVRTGTFLYVPRGVELELPVESFHWLAGDNGSIFPHTLIVAEAGARATVIDYLASADPGAAGFACGVNDLWLGDGAQLTYVCVQDWSQRVLGLQLNSTVVSRDAHARALTMNTGSRYFRSESVSHLRAPGGRSDMLAVTVGEGTQEIDQRTFQIHEAPNTASDLLYKNALEDQARTVFSGLIRVSPGAHRTDAYQKVRNLLLSDDAEANSMPGLEIEADDVRCTHGATSGQIDEEELFYLRSRGIPLREAQRLIVHGFLDEVLARLGDKKLAEALAQRLHAKWDIRH